MVFEPPLEVPAELEAWMRTQSQSAFIGAMLLQILRTGGLSARQIEMVQEERAKAQK